MKLKLAILAFMVLFTIVILPGGYSFWDEKLSIHGTILIDTPLAEITGPAIFDESLIENTELQFTPTLLDPNTDLTEGIRDTAGLDGKGDSAGNTSEGTLVKSTDNGEPAADTGEGTTPVDTGEGTTPVDAGEGTTSVDTGEGTTPVDTGEGTTSVDTGEGTTPVDTGEGTTTESNVGNGEGNITE